MASLRAAIAFLVAIIPSKLLSDVMCNLYQHTPVPAALMRFFEQTKFDLSSNGMQKNFEPHYVGADQDGLVITRDQGRDLSMQTMRWGFPALPQKDGSKRRNAPITNIRNITTSRWWQNVNSEYIEAPEYRCLVPFSRFAEWNKHERANSWFEIKVETPFFAGIWRPWTGERLKEVEGATRRKRLADDWRLYAFLTTEPNDIIRPIHPKAMPVILTTQKECETWLNGGAESFSLQRPLPNNMIHLSERTE